jgi:UDP-glucose 4-epimerase
VAHANVSGPALTHLSPYTSAMAGESRVPPTVLIVGWGFIGAAIGQHLLAAGARVTGLSRSRTSRTDAGERAGARIVIGDVCQLESIGAAVHDVDHVLFSAGGLTPPATAAQPAEAAMQTLLPLLAVLEAMRSRPSVALTYVSSGGTVYGNPRRLPVSEDEPTEPISPYGALHVACENYAQMYSRRFGTRLQILRIANVYGPHQARHKDQGAVAIFLDRITNGQTISVYGDGTALRDYVFIEDVAAAASRLIVDRSDVGVVNLGSERGLTVLEIVDAVETVVGRRANVSFEPARGFDVHAVVLDVSKLQSFIPYTPTNFAAGLRATYEASQVAGVHIA